jgi:hypothetical protein
MENGENYRARVFEEGDTDHPVVTKGCQISIYFLTHCSCWLEFETEEGSRGATQNIILMENVSAIN